MKREEILQILNDQDYLDLNTTFKIFSSISNLINLNKINEAQELVIYTLENYDKLNKSCIEIFSDIIESIGFYPYLEKYNLNLNCIQTKIRKEFFCSENLGNSIYHHREQREILNKLQYKNVIVSAPTSFGKSLLIQEIVASKKYNNIVILQPTLALLDETRKKLKPYLDPYKLIIKTSQEYNENDKNLFILTAERLLEYKNLPKIDFLIIDEFYKLSCNREDDRANILNNAFYILLEKYKVKFLLLGPNIENVSDEFLDKYNAEFYKTSYSLVVNQELDYFGGSKSEQKNKLFDLLFNLKNEQSIVYCSSPARAMSLANEYREFLSLKKEVAPENEILDIIEWLENYVNKNWTFIQNLKYKIGVHHGSIPRHISSSIIEYFNNYKLNVIFCTSTIIEGVNTNSKNIIYFDKKKGRKNIDYFDYSNIKGRAGRMMEHLIGKVYNFNKPPEKELIYIDIPFFEQNPISNEILINIKDKDIKDKESKQYKHLNSIPKDLKPIIQKNGMLVDGQLKIINTLEQDFNSIYKLINWTNRPKYEQLQYILTLGYNNLLNASDKNFPPLKKLIYLTFHYEDPKDIIQNELKHLIKQRKSDSKIALINEAIHNTFIFIKNWTEYKIPKILMTMNTLQEYVCNKKNLPSGDYSFYANYIENGNIRENLRLLLEYNIPHTAIKKIEKLIPDSISEDYIISHIKNNNIIQRANLLTYESNKLKQNL